MFISTILFTFTKQNKPIPNNDPIISSTQRSSKSMYCEGPMMCNTIPAITTNKPNCNNVLYYH